MIQVDRQKKSFENKKKSDERKKMKKLPGLTGNEILDKNEKKIIMEIEKT